MFPDQEPEPEVIIPQYKLIITYDVLPSSHESYFQFVMSELLPTLQEVGVYMTEAWHTAFGNYPLRMASFVAEDLETLDDLLESDTWAELEAQFKLYIRNYSVAVIQYRQGFQFVKNQVAD